MLWTLQYLLFKQYYVELYSPTRIFLGCDYGSCRLFNYPGKISEPLSDGCAVDIQPKTVFLLWVGFQTIRNIIGFEATLVLIGVEFTSKLNGFTLGQPPRIVLEKPTKMHSFAIRQWLQL